MHGFCIPAFPWPCFFVQACGRLLIEITLDETKTEKKKIKNTYRGKQTKKEKSIPSSSSLLRHLQHKSGAEKAEK